MSDRYDMVFVGSGINSLAGAALLARAGKRVLVLERADRLGGAIWTAEITRPGFVHDVLACWHPLFVGSAAYAELAEDLHARGLEYLNTELPTGWVGSDGSSAFLTTSHERNVEELERHARGDGEAWSRVVQGFMPNADLCFGVLTTELWSRAGGGLGLKALRRLGRRGLVELTGNIVVTARDWLTETFASPSTHGLLAPWVLHTGLGPDAAVSGFMTQVIAVAIELGGMPVPKGGGVKLVEALADIVRDAGGALETGQEVERILAENGSVAGVRMTGTVHIHEDSDTDYHFVLPKRPTALDEHVRKQKERAGSCSADPQLCSTVMPDFCSTDKLCDAERVAPQFCSGN